MAFPIVRRLLLIGALTAGLPAAAIPPDRTLAQLEHRSWTAKDGVPPSIITMDQTDDGYLWLGTGAGLFQFDGVRDAAQEVVDEGRERVLELRGRDGHPGALGDYLYQFGQAMAQQHGICFSLSTQGEARELQAAVKTEVQAIGKEALFNAVRHSGSAEVKIELVYASAQFSMTVQDYGRGLDVSVQSSGKRPGHWGLSGMSERAQQVGGQLAIDSRPGVGTTVVFSIIARLAFG